MKELSRIASAAQASTTMAIDSMFKQMKADGIDVIGFAAGEPDFNTPDEIKEAGIAAIHNNHTRRRNCREAFLRFRDVFPEW